MMTYPAASCVSPLKAELGESPVWDVARQRLWWVDIPGRCVHAFDPAGGGGRSWTLEAEPGCVTPTARGDLLVAGRAGVGRLDLETGGFRTSHPLPQGFAGRYNDGKVDPTGRRFYLGTLTDARVPEAAFHVMDAQGGPPRELFGGVTVSNGLAWSGDGRTLYYIDTPLLRVDALDWDAQSGLVGRRRTVFTLPPELGGKPDGMTRDEEGFLWVAHFGGARLSRWNPLTGACVGVLPVPAVSVTSCCFGGADMATLFITTARVRMSEEQHRQMPQAGCLFAARPGVRGVPTPVFEG